MMPDVDPNKTVFISYRREPSEFIARAIHENLISHNFRVFIDVESLDSGRFRKAVFQRIEQSCHFLLVLTPETLERCFEPEDLLRAEIEYALSLEKNIVPVRVYGFEYSNYQKYLTGKLSQLPQYNSPSLSNEHFTPIMEAIRKRYLAPGGCNSEEVKKSQNQIPLQQDILPDITILIPTKAELSAEALFNSAYVKQKNNDLDGAIVDYNKAIRLNPQYAEVYNKRGLAYAAQGDLDAAIADYDAAIRLNANYTTAYSNRGLAHSKKGDLDAAIADYDTSIRFNVDDATTYSNRGLVHADRGDLDTAIADYDAAIRLNPQYAEAYYNRGLARRRKGDLTAAIADYNTAIRLKPDDATAYNNRGTAHAKKGDLTAAIADYNTAIRLRPDDAYAYINRAEIHFEQHKYNEAFTDYTKAEELLDYPIILGGLAITRHALGNTDEARKLWQELVEKDERYKDAEWVRKAFNWAEPLVAEARKVIALL